MIFVTDARGRCVYACPEWEALTGQPSTEALDRGWVLRVHPDDRGTATGILDEALASGAEFSIRYRLLKPDDTPRWVGAGGVPSFGIENGAFIGYLGSITELAGGPPIRSRPMATSVGSCRPHPTRRPCRSTPSTLSPIT
ncbi:PAS domain-containing protein [Methylobacterium tardum]|uniref:PAS domain-containing protein n=1 Tax=Methylobacterium tardum TaxID=374432 RepID=UPI00361E7173